MNTKLVSVIIPFYNNNHVNRCIKSILNQTYKNIEIILVDDGSDDKYIGILDKYKTMIRIYKTRHKGVSYARNYGIKKANGELITFCDSDDTYERDTVEILVTNQNNSFDLVCASYSYNFVKKNKIKKVCFNGITLNNKQNINDYLYPFDNSELINSVCTKMYKKSIIDCNNIYFDENVVVGEDFIFNINYISQIDNMLIISDNILYYYIDNNYLSNLLYDNYFDDRVYLLGKLNDYFIKNKLDNSILNFQYIKSCFSYYMKLCKKKSHKEIKDLIQNHLTMYKSNKYYKKTVINRIIILVWNTNSPSIILLFTKIMNYFYRRYKGRK